MNAMDPTGSPDAIEVFRLGILGGISSHEHDAQDFVVRFNHGPDSLGPVLGRHQQGYRLTGKEWPRRHGQQMYDSGQHVLDTGGHGRLDHYFLSWLIGNLLVCCCFRVNGIRLIIIVIHGTSSAGIR